MYDATALVVPRVDPEETTTDNAPVTERIVYVPVVAVELLNAILTGEVDEGSEPALSFKATVRALVATLHDNVAFIIEPGPWRGCQAVVAAPSESTKAYPVVPTLTGRVNV